MVSCCNELYYPQPLLHPIRKVYKSVETEMNGSEPHHKHMRRPEKKFNFGQKQKEPKPQLKQIDEGLDEF